MRTRVVTNHAFEFDWLFVGDRHFTNIMINNESLLASLRVDGFLFVIREIPRQKVLPGQYTLKFGLPIHAKYLWLLRVHLLFSGRIPGPIAKKIRWLVGKS